jgi:hypothetical protein
MCVASSSQPSPRDLIAGPTPAPYARDGPFAARPDLPHSAVRGSRERGARFLAPSPQPSPVFRERGQEARP